MSRPTFLAALAFALAASSTVAQDSTSGSADVPVVGGSSVTGTWTTATITQTEVDLLVQATSNETYYSDSVSEPVCLIALQALQTQVVAGTNYKFQVAGCATDFDGSLGACVDRDCDQGTYDIVVFSQSWTDTIEVTSVSLHE